MTRWRRARLAPMSTRQTCCLHGQHSTKRGATQHFKARATTRTQHHFRQTQQPNRPTGHARDAGITIPPSLTHPGRGHQLLHFMFNSITTCKNSKCQVRHRLLCAAPVPVSSSPLSHQRHHHIQRAEGNRSQLLYERGPPCCRAGLPLKCYFLLLLASPLTVRIEF